MTVDTLFQSNVNVCIYSCQQFVARAQLKQSSRNDAANTFKLLDIPTLYHVYSVIRGVFAFSEVYKRELKLKCLVFMPLLGDIQ